MNEQGRAQRQAEEDARNEQEQAEDPWAWEDASDN